jgi:hypothetical protein
MERKNPVHSLARFESSEMLRSSLTLSQTRFIQSAKMFIGRRKKKLKFLAVCVCVCGVDRVF